MLFGTHNATMAMCMCTMLMCMCMRLWVEDNVTVQT